MKILIVLILLTISAASEPNLEALKLQGPSILDTNLCNSVSNVTHHQICNFGVNFYKTVSKLSGYHYIVSPCSIWIILAAIAEGADNHMQQRLFQFLNLPNDHCVRKNIYNIATRRLLPEDNVKFFNTRVIVVDQGVSLNSNWYKFVVKNSLTEVLSSPIKKYPQIAGNDIRRIMHGALPSLNLKGNSVLLDAFEYSGLWATAFSDAVVQRAPFYDHNDRRIGAVDLMTMRKRAKIIYVPDINANILELPVGANGLYRVIFALPVNGGILVPAFDFLKSSAFFEMQGKSKESDTPIDVAIPTFTMTSEIDVRKILEDIGMADIWTTPSATKFISSPPALPSSFIQRATVTLSKDGVYPSPVKQEFSKMAIRHPTVGQRFIADRPFVFGLYDKNYSCLMLSIYSKPTYN